MVKVLLHYLIFIGCSRITSVHCNLLLESFQHFSNHFTILLVAKSFIIMLVKIVHGKKLVQF